MGAAGAALWTDNGVLVCGDGADQVFPTIVSTDDGGAILMWNDTRNQNGDVYAQRVGADGSPLWTPAGVAISTASGDQANPAVIADGTRGAIAAWSDDRVSPDVRDIYAQRITRNGNLGPAPFPAMPRQGLFVLASLLLAGGLVAMRRRAARTT